MVRLHLDAIFACMIPGIGAMLGFSSDRASASALHLEVRTSR